MTGTLDQKVAIITGAAQGIGFGIAEVLADAGASVAITDVDLGRAEKAVRALTDKGVTAVAVQQDVTDPRSTAQVLEYVEAELGIVSVLVNNAGIGRQEPIVDVAEATWDLITGVNSKGLFFSVQAGGRYFAHHGGGRIVNIASMTGKNAIENYSVYNASKFAAIGITQSAALDLASRGVTVNAVCPGLVRTPMWDALPAEQWEAQVRRVPLGFAQTAHDIGHAVAFLASDGARSITGASIAVTGGLQMW